jgi:hypothetical protein
MKINIYQLAFAVCILLACNGCATLHIDRGHLNDNDVTITITGEYPGDGHGTFLPFKKPVVLNGGSNFDLEKQGLIENKPVSTKKVCNTSGYRMHGITSYEVKIQAAGRKELYGRIAFFEAKSKAIDKPVTNYYQVSVYQMYNEVSDGRTPYYFEYYTLAKRYPTWILWGAEQPFK